MISSVYSTSYYSCEKLFSHNFWTIKILSNFNTFWFNSLWGQRWRRNDFKPTSTIQLIYILGFRYQLWFLNGNQSWFKWNRVEKVNIELICILGPVNEVVISSKWSTSIGLICRWRSNNIETGLSLNFSYRRGVSELNIVTFNLRTKFRNRPNATSTNT